MISRIEVPSRVRKPDVITEVGQSEADIVMESMFKAEFDVMIRILYYFGIVVTSRRIDQKKIGGGQESMVN